MSRTECKKYYSLLRQKNTNVSNAPIKEEIENFWGEKNIWKKGQILEWPMT
jgi:hypothetical protein